MNRCIEWGGVDYFLRGGFDCYNDCCLQSIHILAASNNNDREMNMRTFIAAALGILGLINVATCAQAQTSAARDWSGSYLGGSVGAVESRAATEASTADGFPGSYFTPPDPQQIIEEADGSLSQSSLSGGVFGGFGRQFGNLYLGLEVSANTLGFDETRTSGAVYLSNSAGAFTQELSVKADWQATMRARLGWAQERWLVYLTGGAAVARIELDAAFSDDFLGVGARGRNSTKETKLGWVVGLGGEYALSENWSIRGDYLYADYGKVDTSATVTNPAFPVFANTLKSSAQFKTQTLSVGMAYRF